MNDRERAEVTVLVMQIVQLRDLCTRAERILSSPAHMRPPLLAQEVSLLADLRAALG